MSTEIQLTPEPPDTATRNRSPENIKLERELSELLEAYRNALKFASRLPGIGWWPVTEVIRSERRDKPHETKGKGHRLIARPFVQLFLESHIRKKLDSLLDNLRIEAISLDEEVGLWVKRLQEIRGSLRNWRNTYSLLTRAPLVSLLLPFLAPVLLQAFGFDFSGPSEIVNSAVTLYQTRRSSIVSGIAIGAILLLYLYTFLVPIVVRFGFRCKRAILSGGITDDYHLFGKLVDKNTEEWENFPDANIYHKENQVFQILGATKPSEFPLDLVLTPVPYLALLFACGISLYVVIQFKAGAFPASTIDAIGAMCAFFAAWAWTILIVRKALMYYQRRKEQEQM